MIKYIVGVLILTIIGFTGGNIMFTAIEIGVVYSILEMSEDDNNTPRGT
jgi:hypothetical protein|tara:strand:+ start:4307 stop:4453 length:147 start_codon:yes stop_codon:yes gene_type:complete